MIGHVLLILSLYNLESCLGFSLSAGKIGEYDINDIESCDNDGGFELDIAFDKQDDIKSATGKFLNGVPFNDKMEFRFQVDKWTGSEWKDKFIVLQGNACKSIRTLLKTFYENLLDNIEPKVTDKDTCSVGEGTYEFKDFKAKASDIMIPGLVYGKYRAKVSTFDPKEPNKILSCIQGEGEVKP